MRAWVFHLLLFYLLASVGCERQTAQPPSLAAQPTVFEVNGVLKEIRSGNGRVSIAHETIPGYMEAMTMEFETSDPRELAGLHPGDSISFRLLVTPEHGTIDQIRFRGVAVPQNQDASKTAAPAVLAAGDRLPAISLVDHTGRPFQLRELGGRALAFTFIFTRCPFPDYCPRMNAQFAALQRDLKQEAAQLLSISIDPAYDTPSRLAEYSARYHPDPAKWRFATGDPAEIGRLGDAFGLSVAPRNGALDHKLRTIVVNKNGRIEKVFSGNEWNVTALIEALKSAAEEE